MIAFRDFVSRYAMLAVGAFMLVMFLAGCQTTRYVQTPCISKDQLLPAEPPKVADKLTGRADEDLKTVAGSAVRLRAWGQGLHSILEGCRGYQTED
jgi:hypothetical protein